MPHLHLLEFHLELQPSIQHRLLAESGTYRQVGVLCTPDAWEGEIILGVE